MSESALERTAKENRELREKHLGEFALTLLGIPYLSHLDSENKKPPLAISGSAPHRVDERGRVHLTPPVRILTSEHKVLAVQPKDEEVVISGDAFNPLITERESVLYSEFSKYMLALNADPLWYEKPIPTGGYAFPRMNTEEKNAWGRWLSFALLRATQVPHHQRVGG